MIMKTAAAALNTVHINGIIHSDIKKENILLVKNKTGHYVAKLVDFDSSYPSNEKKYPGGFVFSPELADYFDEEEDEELKAELLKKISVKTDIFSLGSCFYYYLLQEYSPDAVELSENLKKEKMRKESRGQTVKFETCDLLRGGCELKLSDKIKSARLKALILDMLSFEPENRPYASEVLERLKKIETEPEICEPWPEHGILLDPRKLSSKKIGAICRIKDGNASKYEIVFSTGKKQIQSKEDLIASGCAKPIIAKEGFEEPWPEHAIIFDETELKSMGFVALARETKNGVNGYRVYYPGSAAGVFYTYGNLLGAGLAKKKNGPIASAKPITTETDFSKFEPWPEHSIKLLPKNILESGFVGVEKGEKNGKKGYFFIRGDEKRTRQFFLVNMVLVQGWAETI